MSSIYLWYLARAMKEMDGDLTGYMKKSLPVWLYFFLYVLLIVHCIIEAGYGAYVFADVMKKKPCGRGSLYVNPRVDSAGDSICHTIGNRESCACL